ncbi:ATP-binding protein [Brachyspira hyodysenteriae]|uniref:AAA family ATPase n=1 Tax=Brachyspira hyodysenteriae TaxID=159 RepID=UPI0011828D36|nr:ATP-binding protein [Brachyspira hyodysenteriae]TVL41309.1 ATP-binding protein [Brachyspira hyodysenteriae]
MYVENVRINNFTVFKDCYTDFSKGVNIFIGENGTGKTHLLKAIYCLNESFYEIVGKNRYRMYVDDLYYPFSSKNILLNKFIHNQSEDKINDIKIELINSFKELKNNNDKLKEYIKKIFNEYHDLVDNWELIFNNIVFKLIQKKCGIKSDNFFYENIFTLYDKNNVKDNESLFDDNEYTFKDKKFTYIPCKDILTNSKGFISLYNKREVSFESVYYDILNKAFVPQLRELDPYLEDITKKIENAIGGIVIQKDEVFFIKYKDFGEVQFTMVAEGHKKLALLWLLIKNGEIDKDTILLFDEPESNLNPKLTRVLVEILLSLSRLGVQIFLATHNNFIIEDFELQRKENDKIKFHSFYFDEDKKNGVLIESNEYLNNIQHNSIEDKFEEQHLQSIEKAFKN